MRVHKRLFLSVQIFVFSTLFLFACKTRVENNSEVQSIATAKDITVAQEIIGDSLEIGSCKLTSVLKTNDYNKNYIDLEFSYTGTDNEVYEKQFKFSNHEASRSRVDVVYGKFGLSSDVKRIELVDVELNTAPGIKYELTFDVENEKPTQLQLTSFVGFRSNDFFSIKCVE